MTKVLVRLYMPEVYGVDIPAPGHVEFRPTIRVNTTEGVMLPAPTTVTLRDGKAEVDLLPNEAGIWAWMVDEKVQGGKMRWVNVPEDTGIVLTYEDLVDVDPTSLSPANPETIEAWRQIKAQVDQNTADIEDLQQNGGGGSGGDGSLWWTGAGDPVVTLGTNGDFYLRGDGQVLQKTEGVWVATTTNLRGPQGQGIEGTDGTDGADGQSPELRLSGGFVQWKYPSQQTWTNLIPLTAITGPSGDDGTNGTNGTNGTDGLGWTGGSYNPETGIVTFTSDDGLGFATGDLRGADGGNGTDGNDGLDGVGIQSVTDNENGTMTVLLTNGTSSIIDLPEGPQGIQGNPGTAASITVGTTTTGAAGTQASVEATGPSTARVLNFTIPRGAQGIQGIQGVPGPGIPIASGSPVTPTAEWFGTQAQYDAIATKVSTVIYNILVG